MHMADALLSPAVGGAMCAVSAAANAYAVRGIKKDELSEKKVPLMGVMGAFVFAAQMVNFTIPATGSSGHIGGGMLLAAVMGGPPALLSITAVLIIQCLFFADGGLLALGCNIFNIGVIPCLVIYPLCFKPLLKKGVSARRLTVASVVSVVAALQLGSLGVVLQTQLSGVTELPFTAFVWLMQPIHLAIGAAEGVITAAVLCFIYAMRPEILDGAAAQKGVPMRKALVTLAVLTLLVGGGLSLLASSNPDGLEWAIERTAGELPEAASGGARVQEVTAFMPEYDFKEAVGSGLGTSVAGVVGGAITFALAGVVALAIALYKKKSSA